MKEIDMKKISSVISLSFFIIVLFVTPVIGSSEWVDYGRNKDGDVYFYMKINIDKGKGKYIVQVWDKQLYFDKGREKIIQIVKKMGWPTEEWNKIEDVMSFYEIDCKKKGIRKISYIFFDTSGNSVYSRSYDNLKWVFIPPDTMLDILQKKVCE